MDTRRIQPGMIVVSSDGKTLGSVRRGRDGSFMLRGKKEGELAALPPEWVTRVDNQVHIRHSAAAVNADLRGEHADPQPGQKGGPFLKIAITLLLLIIAAIIVSMIIYHPDGAPGRG